MPEEPGRSQAGKKRHLRLALGLLLLGGLLSQLDFELTVGLFERANLWWVLPIIAVQLLDRYLMAWKWALLLNHAERWIGNFEAFKIYFISSFQGFLIPFGIGPDVVRFFRLPRQGIPREIVGASLVVERSLGLLASGVSALISLAVLFTLLEPGVAPEWLFPLTVGTGAGATLFLAAIFIPPLRHRMIAWLLRQRERIGSARLGKYVEALGSYREHGGVLARFTLWSVAEQFMTTLAVYFAARALHIPLSLLVCIAFVPVTELLERLPISVMGLGIREGSFAFFLGLLGIGYSQAVVLGLFEFGIFVVTLLPAAAWSLLDARRGTGAPPAGREGSEGRAESASGHRAVNG